MEGGPEAMEARYVLKRLQGGRDSTGEYFAHHTPAPEIWARLPGDMGAPSCKAGRRFYRPAIM